MVKTHLPAHMDSVRQKLRPKHQLLILKCYPRLPKNSAADVRPNGSELSYLVYYASTRRSKLQKVGAFLERKTSVDLSRFQSASVLVTLQILTALLENKAIGGGSGFALIAPFVLRIIREVLRDTTDISLNEASLETWESFCNHQDEATLKADHEYRELYESVVRHYAMLADRESSKRLGRSTQPVAVQDAIRLREAGLGALRSVLVSDSLAHETGRQLDLVVPAILSNMRGDNAAYLTNLVRLGKKSEEDEQQKALARRISMATTRTHTGTTDGSSDADPRRAEGTTQDADEFAEEEVAILALDCLRDVFANDNRPLVRGATLAMLKYLSSPRKRPDPKTSEKPQSTLPSESWACKLFEICTMWTPVQDRFVLVVTVVEAMGRLPLQEPDLAQHLLYTNLLDHIFYSDLNLIGLSVMDVLLSLVQQILRILQLNGPRIAGRGSRSHTLASEEEKSSSVASSARNSPPSVPSEECMQLLGALKQAIAHLGTHVYYSDQIADMISAILLRLKPNPAPTGMQNPIITAAAIEEPKAAVTEVASNVSLAARERPNTATSGFFSFETARQIALETVRDILRTSNSTRSLSTGGVSNSRNKVPVWVWEGTQWLLRDPSPAVRRAYTDALTTWLRLETSRADARVKQPKDKQKKISESAFARRALSNASNKKDKQSKKATNTFLQLLHLAVFENVLQFSDVEVPGADKEILALHYLLTTLVQRLGVNAVQSGLPMIFALQEEMGKSTSLASQVGIGSIVHGYLWVLADVYDFDVSPVGQDIFSEIKRRKERKLWIRDLSMPPKILEDIWSSTAAAAPIPSDTEDHPLRPFEQRPELVERIADSYALTAVSPSPSAPSSPGRTTPGHRRISSSLPALDKSASSYLTVKPQANPLLPDKVKDAMMETWTKEGCLNAIAAAAPKSISISGSQSSPSQALAAGNHRQILAAANAKSSRNPSPLPSGQRTRMSQARAPAGQQALGTDLTSGTPARRQSVSTTGKASSSGLHGRLRVDDLKRVLSGGGFTAGMVSRFSDRGDDDQDTISDSLVDVGAEDLGSETGFVTPPSRVEGMHHDPGIPPPIPEDLQITPKRPQNPAEEEPPLLELQVDNGTASDTYVSPAPNGANGFGRPVTSYSPRGPPSRGKASIRSDGVRGKKDIATLLAGIGGEDGDIPPVPVEKRFPSIGKPPY